MPDFEWWSSVLGLYLFEIGSQIVVSWVNGQAHLIHLYFEQSRNMVKIWHFWQFHQPQNVVPYLVDWRSLLWNWMLQKVLLIPSTWNFSWKMGKLHGVMVFISTCRSGRPKIKFAGKTYLFFFWRELLNPLLQSLRSVGSFCKSEDGVEASFGEII